MPEVLLSLPEEEREAFKEPMGPITTDAETLLSWLGDPVVAVGDVVTAHLQRAGHPPDVAVVDGRTRRGAVSDDVNAALPEADQRVENPPATLTRELLTALAAAVDARSGTILVEGEEDLAALPAVLLAADGASVVYGQPGEGMVHAQVDATLRDSVRSLLARLDGDQSAVLSILDD